MEVARGDFWSSVSTRSPALWRSTSARFRKNQFLDGHSNSAMASRSPVHSVATTFELFKLRTERAEVQDSRAHTFEGTTSQKLR